MVNQDFCLSEHDLHLFQTQGFVVLKSFLSAEFIAHIRERITESMRLMDESNTGFNRVGYDIFGEDSMVEALLSEPKFGQTLTTLTQRSLFFTQGLGFEIKKNKHSGFPWHIGTQSFGYQRGEDYGCSMWVPMVPIDPQVQGGGMCYVPTNKISGRFMYTDIDPTIDAMMRDQAEADQDSLDLNQYLELRHSILNSEAMSQLLEHNKQVDSFELGDIFLFNKHVIHASEPLLEGSTETRAAFVMRFVEIDSRYDQLRATGLDFPLTYFGHPPSSYFHRDVCQQDGELIRQSPLFTNADIRTLTQD